MFCGLDEHRLIASSLAGAFLWAVVAGLAGSRRAPFGVIELLLMFAVLVVVPLGLELTRTVTGPGFPGLEKAARAVQPLAALGVVAAFWVGPGNTAGILVIPWAVTTSLVALSGLAGLRVSQSVADYVGNIARVDLGVAGGWLLASRLGVRTGFQEPIALLTAVHFHYSGFATALIAASGARWAQGTSHESDWRRVALAIAVLPFAVAAGFVFSPVLRMVAVSLLALAMAGLSGLLLSQGKLLAAARVFLRVSASFILVGMSLAAIYAAGEYTHRAWLTIPRMASTHGWINAMGFVLPGLLGWLVQFHAQPGSEGMERGTIRARQTASEFRPAFLARDFYDR
jgi:YndJ-like protein